MKIPFVFKLSFAHTWVCLRELILSWDGLLKLTWLFLCIIVCSAFFDVYSHMHAVYFAYACMFSDVNVSLVVTFGCLWCIVCSCLGLMVIHAGRRGGETDRKPEDHAVTELLYNRDIRLGRRLSPLQPAVCSLVMQCVYCSYHQ